LRREGSGAASRPSDIVFDEKAISMVRNFKSSLRGAAFEKIQSPLLYTPPESARDGCNVTLDMDDFCSQVSSLATSTRKNSIPIERASERIQWQEEVYILKL